MAKIIIPQYVLELAYAPLDGMTDDELVYFCEQNRELRVMTIRMQKLLQT